MSIVGLWSLCIEESHAGWSPSLDIQCEDADPLTLSGRSSIYTNGLCRIAHGIR